MDSEFEKIKELASQYQDKREDEGHAETVINFAIKLLETAEANQRVIIPAAILHDIGWSQLPDRQRLIIWNQNATIEEKKLARFAHQEQGVRLAKQILEEINYPQDKIKEILEIISQHDTRQGFISKNEGLVRDADKLSRFSKNDLFTLRKQNKTNKELQKIYEKLENQITEENFFYSEKAKQIAREELKNRKNEIVKD